MVVFILILASLSWLAAMITWLVFMVQRVEKWEIEKEAIKFEIEQKKEFINKMGARAESLMPSMAKITNRPTEIPEKIKELMKSSPDHPEVEEIDPTDMILGVRFEADSYPPGFGDVDDD
jgi:predicted transcriptional regulator